MSDAPDAELLEQFARNQSEAAFAELVRRHIGLVYSAAFRITENPRHAEDITQAVFIILARKAGSLGPKTVLPGWLYHTARLTAANFQRAEVRRIRREQEVFMQSTMKEPATDALWQELSPLLEDAMAGLGASDRDAIVLRYFQNRNLADVGATLGIAERAAQKRVDRALEKLRKFFSKRGVESTPAIIAGVLSSNSTHTVPAALAKSVTAVAITQGATAATSTLTLVKGALTVMAWTKTKTTILAGVAVLLIGGSGTIIALKEKEKARQEYLKDPVAYEVSHQPPVKDENELRNELVGTWQLVAEKDWGEKQFVYFPTNNYYRKIFDLTNETVLGYDSQSNLLFSSSGPYTLHGSNYTESLQTATGGLARSRGAHPRFKIRVDGDMFYQEGFGKNPNIKEIWRRVKTE